MTPDEIKARLLRLADQFAAPDVKKTQDKWEADRQAANEMRQAMLKQEARIKSWIPRELWGKFDSPLETEALSIVRDFLGNEKLFCFLSGSAGVGKTFAAAWAVDQRGGIFVDSYHLSTVSQYADDVWRRFSFANVLALDEMGADVPQPDTIRRIYSLLNSRYQNGRKTILASNLSPGDWQQKYGIAKGQAMERLLDRFRAQNGLYCPKVLTGRSLR